MKVGFLLPIADDAATGTPTWSRIAELARHAEAGGIDSLWIFDHLIFRFPDEPESGLHEAWTLVAAVAAVTSRVEIGTIVLATPFRPAAWLAKAAATADLIADGRLILGIGAGWHEPEFQAFGYPFDHRVGRFEEALGVIKPLLDGQRVTFHGRWTDVDDVVLLPPPPRPHLPILIAAKGERMLRLTATHADAWNTAWFGFPDDRWRQRVADLRAACEAVGRDPATLELTVGVRTDSEPVIGPAGTPVSLPNDLSAVTDALAAWAAEGVGHVQFDTNPKDERIIDLVLEARERSGVASSPASPASRSR
jgi:probable F420-dependent oxidoreductase